MKLSKKRKEFLNDFVHGRIRARRTGTYQDIDGLFIGQIFAAFQFLLLFVIEMPDEAFVENRSGGRDEVGRELFFTQLHQVCGIGTVVSADHNSQVGR